MSKLTVTIGDQTNGGQEAMLHALDELLKDSDMVVLEAWHPDSGEVYRMD